MFFKTLNIRQRRTVIPERQETIEVMPTLSKLLALRQLVGYGAFGGAQVEWGRVPDLRISDEGPGRPRWLELTGQNAREEKAV